MAPLTAAAPQAYRENAVLSASPSRLVVMLYDGARRYLRQAADAMGEGDVERAHNTLRQAEMIIAHLDGVLDYEQGGELAQRLHAIYQFCLAHLNRARMSQDSEQVGRVSEMLGELRESWAQIAHG
jgi:flagellar protein FliS